MNNIDKFLDISLLIPCYNSEKTLDRLFNSVIKQKYPLRYLKIITINDGSSDNTLGKLQE
jgi:glycosyltransferase involved in cell wall biosynthesis